MHTPGPSDSPQSILMDRQSTICIIGGGFGGLYTALYLQKYRHLNRSQIVLIEPKDRFLFTPMMYELITDELKDWEIAPTYSSLIAGRNILWKQTKAKAIDLEKQIVTTNCGQCISYDYLVVARGANSKPVDIPGVDEHALSFRSLQDALTLRSRLAQLSGQQRPHSNLPSALSNSHSPIYITVVGGGPSGVELACKVADYLGGKGFITLVERGTTILKPFAKGLRRLTQEALKRRNVRILTESTVSAVGANSVTLEIGNSQEVLPSHLTLWAVGTQPHPWLGPQVVPHNSSGQRITHRSLQLIGYENVFLLGDGADVRDRKNRPAPNTAQAAFQAANRVAANIAAMTQGRPLKAFNYLHLGDMLTLGIGEAGLWSFGITLGGTAAAFCRRGIYIFRMPTRRHQVKVARRAIKELGRAVFRPVG